VLGKLCARTTGSIIVDVTMMMTMMMDLICYTFRYRLLHKSSENFYSFFPLECCQISGL